MKHGFVILHYLAYDMTRECVDNLIKRFPHAFIVIVDNASYNETGKQLKEYYASNENVEVLLNKENAGFARGNNLGYSYFKQKLELDFMIIMNNDVLIYDDDFLGKVESIYEEEHFDILGPDIYVRARNLHQSPARCDGLWKKEELDGYIEYLTKMSNHYFVNRHIEMSKSIMRRIKNKIKKILKYKVNGYDNRYYEKQYNPMLHGACYIFSRDYIEKNDTAFNPATFMFMEEDILWYESMKKGLKILYSPQIQAEHLEDVSSDMAFKTDYKKEKMKSKELLKSAKILRALMNS